METQLEERLTFVEARIDEHSRAIEEIKSLILNLDQKIDRRIDALEQKNDRRFEAIDRRFEAIDQKFSKYFLWIIGIQVSVLLAVIASMLR